MTDYHLVRHVAYARPLIVLTVTLGVLGTGATIAQMTLLSRIVAGVFLGRENRAGVGGLLVLLLVVIVLRAGLLWWGEVVAQRGARRITARLRERLLTHVALLGPAYTRGEQTGELAATAMEGCARLQAYYSGYVPRMALAVLVPVAILAWVLPLDWVSAALLLATAPVIPLLMVAVGSYAQDRAQRQWQVLSRMSAQFLDALQGLPTLKLFGGGAAERERVATVSSAFGVTTLSVLRVAFLSGLVLEFMTSVSIGLLAVALGLRLLNGEIGFERAFLILLLAPDYYRPLRELGAGRHAALEGRAAAERIVGILRTPVPVAPVVAPSSGARSRLAVPLTIELEGVTYTYPGGLQPALRSVDLLLPAGTLTALVGVSGAGKSTLINLLLRFLSPQGGSVRANGVAVESLSAEAWRTLVALVPQRPYLFQGSVRDNISLARPNATPEEVARAAGISGAAEFIARLPRGYETPLGERGARLSGGEAQRLALARAVLKDAPLLILDEPTSSLDPLSERLVREAVGRLVEGRTVLVVAHRVATVRAADQIVVLEGGRVVESGRHDDLVARGGAYACLAQRQHEVAV